MSLIVGRRGAATIRRITASGSGRRSSAAACCRPAGTPGEAAACCRPAGTPGEAPACCAALRATMRRHAPPVPAAVLCSPPATSPGCQRSDDGSRGGKKQLSLRAVQSAWLSSSAVYLSREFTGSVLTNFKSARALLNRGTTAAISRSSAGTLPLFDRSLPPPEGRDGAALPVCSPRAGTVQRCLSAARGQGRCSAACLQPSGTWPGSHLSGRRRDAGPPETAASGPSKWPQLAV